MDVLTQLSFIDFLRLDPLDVDGSNFLHKTAPVENEIIILASGTCSQKNANFGSTASYVTVHMLIGIILEAKANNNMKLFSKQLLQLLYCYTIPCTITK